LKVGNLSGKQVITSNACNLGEVEGVQADIKTWQITHIDVDLTKEAANELNFKKPMFGSVMICVPVTAINEVGDVITLNTTLLELKNLKECKAE
jgi:sporulation protein YlmC with PRC-barrel domain